MNNIHRRILLALVAILASAGMSLSAQQHVISGCVMSVVGDEPEPVIGANVVLVNSQNRYIKGAVTDFDGNYTLEVPANAGKLKIQASYIGMETQSVPYTGQATQDFTLESVSTLKEVTFVAQKTDDMGITKRLQTGSIQKLEVTDLVEQSPVASIEEAIQGQISGLDISIGGDPGAKNAIQIRGISSLDDNSDPLIVVDGVPYTTDISDDFSFSTASAEDFGALLNIAPTNIESIEVLKDASATAIYGSSGANGVILINTKKGSRGKTTFSLSTKITSKHEPSTIPLLNGRQYTALMQDALWNAANAKGVSSAATEMDMLFNSDEINYNRDYRYYDEYNCDTDWLGYVKQDALIFDNNFAMSGGGEKATYRLSVNQYSEDGTTKGTDLSRLQAQFKITYNFTDRLRVHTDFSFTSTSKNANVVENVRAMAMARMPNLSPYWIDDATGLPSDRYFMQESDFQGGFQDIKDNKGRGYFNPVAMANDGFYKTSLREEKMTIRLDYDFPFKLKFQGWVSLNMKTNKYKQFVPQSATGVLWNNPYANRSSDAINDSFTLQSEMKFLYNNTFNEKHNIVATALVRTYQTNSFSESSATYGNASSSLADPVVGSVVAGAGSSNGESRSINLVAQAVYAYDERYSLKASITYEGNSAMGSRNRFGSYPAFGVAWNIDREHFLRDNPNFSWLDEAKVRVSLGWSGKAPSGAAKYFGAYSSAGQYVDQQAIAALRMQLDRLKWQTTREIDYGLDMRLWDRLNLTFDYYDKTTSDLLLKDTSLPATTGYDKIAWINSGKLSNKGVEFRFDVQAFRNKDWNLSFNANISRNINKVEELPSTYVQENYELKNGEYALRIVEGSPIGAFYGYRYKGVYQNTAETYARDAQGNVMYDYQGMPIIMQNNNETVYPGDARYEDINHDGVINENDIVYLGNANPKFTAGGGFKLKWKDFMLTTFFYGRFGQKVINQARIDLESMYGKNNQSTAVLQRWRAEGDQTDIPRALYGMGYNYLGSDRFVEDASFVRLKTLSLNYNIPKKFLEKLHIGLTRANMFVTGYDLFTWTSYKGQDPEVSLPTATKLVKDNSQTPVSKRYAFGLTLNF
ncbi:MAG: SusC/RagA family TonB-linked outer membrane protein [Bacteroides sp.]|nr:SusC/RagA family TonB-linked outer membrane protein [Bacteroides sp.]